ncbi:hypothetical protein MPUL_45270 [Mycolicibacterium pulveris]|uniref:Xylulokinase n=1 Tax=Mycolicibacterium pulveris TaxID=36813 RepID=A0A7I7US20_MYCPV|nr:hypothetical protein MPUL_45270 [Mycolicibacterium pulveris]
MDLVAGIDSSTQSCKVVVCRADTGEIIRSACSPHPADTEVGPRLWWSALQTTINAAAALGLGAALGDGVVSLGTSGVVSAVSDTAPHDAEGLVAGFADATGRQLPLVCTLNGAPVLAAVARMLNVDFTEFDRMGLSAP